MNSVVVVIVFVCVGYILFMNKISVMFMELMNCSNKFRKISKFKLHSQVKYFSLQNV